MSEEVKMMNTGRILVVDDDEATRPVFLHVLKYRTVYLLLTGFTNLLLF